MDKDLEILINQYQELEDEIRTYLHSLSDYGNECHCGGLDQIDLINSDQTGVATYCTECGGYVCEHELLR